MVSRSSAHTKIYSHYGINGFIICCGYKGYVIKEYFANYFLHTSDVISIWMTAAWRFTAGRLNRGKSPLLILAIPPSRLVALLGCVTTCNDLFCFTYGDGVADVNISALLDHHRKSGRLATLTAVQPPGRFGVLELEGDQVNCFHEKPDGDNAWINGGFFVLNPAVIDLISGDDVMWEREPLQALAAQGQLTVYRHHGFWLPMDTLRDRQMLEQLWASGEAPWKMW